MRDEQKTWMNKAWFICWCCVSMWCCMLVMRWLYNHKNTKPRWTKYTHRISKPSGNEWKKICEFFFRQKKIKIFFPKNSVHMPSNKSITMASGRILQISMWRCRELYEPHIHICTNSITREKNGVIAVRRVHHQQTFYWSDFIQRLLSLLLPLKYCFFFLLVHRAANFFSRNLLD